MLGNNDRGDSHQKGSHQKGTQMKMDQENRRLCKNHCALFRPPTYDQIPVVFRDKEHQLPAISVMTPTSDRLTSDFGSYHTVCCPRDPCDPNLFWGKEDDWGTKNKKGKPD